MLRLFMSFSLSHYLPPSLPGWSKQPSFGTCLSLGSQLEKLCRLELRNSVQACVSQRSSIYGSSLVFPLHCRRNAAISYMVPWSLPSCEFYKSLQDSPSLQGFPRLMLWIMSVSPSHSRSQPLAVQSNFKKAELTNIKEDSSASEEWVNLGNGNLLWTGLTTTCSFTRKMLICFPRCTFISKLFAIWEKSTCSWSLNEFTDPRLGATTVFQCSYHTTEINYRKASYHLNSRQSMESYCPVHWGTAGPWAESRQH